MTRIIAEISGNHGGSIEHAKLLIEQAHIYGADAVKLQAYTPDTITLPHTSADFTVNWRGKNITLHELYQWAHTPFEWLPELFDLAQKKNIHLFATAFDHTSIELLESLNCPEYKIASFEIVDTELIRHAASTGKPLIISTGMATLEEIDRAVEAAQGVPLTLMHCISAYPALPADAHLQNIPALIKRYNCQVGLSDHTIGNATAIAAVALGASSVEKHVSLNPGGDGPDDHFSIPPEAITALGYETQMAQHATIKPALFGVRNSEKDNNVFRRSLYYTQDIEPGTIITNEYVRSVRPGYGVSPHLITEILGRKATRHAYKFTPVQHGDWE